MAPYFGFVCKVFNFRRIAIFLIIQVKKYPHFKLTYTYKKETGIRLFRLLYTVKPLYFLILNLTWFSCQI